MKKLISILIVGVMFISCNYIKEEDVVRNVEEFKKGRYEVCTDNYTFYTNSSYKIGDTLKISKK